MMCAGPFRGGHWRARWCSVHRLCVAQLIQVFPLHAGLLLLGADGVVRHSTGLLLGMRVCLSGLLPHLVHHSLPQDLNHLVHRLSHHRPHLSRCVLGTLLWDHRLVSEQDQRTAEAIRSRLMPWHHDWVKTETLTSCWGQGRCSDVMLGPSYCLKYTNLINLYLQCLAQKLK